MNTSPKTAPDFSEGAVKSIAGYLGLAQKAGKLAAGDRAALAAIEKNQAKLVVRAADASPKVAEELEQALTKRAIPLLVFADKRSLGVMVGKSPRGALAVLDLGLARAILRVAAEEISPDPAY